MSPETVALPRIILTKRLTLRPWLLADVDDVMAYAQDPTWARRLPVPQPYERRHAVEWVARAYLTDWEHHPRSAIELNGRAVGGTELSLEWDHRRAELHYAIGSAHWGQGFVVEAAMALVELAFETAGLNRVYVRIDPQNTRSIRVAEKLGMQHEGVSRQQRLHNNEPIDVVHLGILKSEWEGPES